MTVDARDRAIANCLHVMAGQGQGLYSLDLYPDWMLPQAYIAARAGDLEACQVLGYFKAVSKQIDSGEPTLCLTCNVRFGRDCFPGAVSVLQPFIPNPEHGVAQALCVDCAGRLDVRERILTALKSMLGWDALRLINQHHEGGRA
jgi:hypothetical protein